MKDKYLYWEIPSSVDLEGYLTEHPPTFKYHIDYFYHILEYLSIGMEMEDLDSNAGFVNLSSVKLQKIVHNYKEYLDHLLKNKFIRTDMKYIVGEKCKGYLISKYSYHKASVKKIEIIKSVIKKNRSKNAKESKLKLEKTKNNYPHLTKWFNESLKINVEDATKKVEELFPEQTGGIRGTIKGKANLRHKRFKAIYSIQKFNKQDFYYSVDDNVGRFHSNLTNIKSELRNFITYDSKKLVNIDIKNSQPLFSTLLFNETFYKEGQLINIFKIPTSFPLLSNSKSSYLPTIIMLVKTLNNIDIQKVNNYFTMVNSGEFYQKISDLTYPNKEFVKKSIKEMIFTVFFSNNRFIGQPEAQSKRDFRDNFPEVYNMFKAIKIKNHRALAHLLQRIESIIIIENVTLRISKEKPDLPIFTIHDSVATIIGYEDYVTSIIKEEVLKLTGLNVRLGKEYWKE
tara:strand:- start:9301 stop:10665 length:1365 start_codon:yes stop_codon:yes gene_type:complete